MPETELSSSEKLVEEYPEWFEQFLLVQLLRNPKLFHTHMEKICGPKTRSKDWKKSGMPISVALNHRDFKSPPANFLFELARQYYACTEEDTQLVPPTLIENWSRRMETAGDLMPRESEQITALYGYCLSVPPEEVAGYAPLFTTEAILYWLQKARVRSITDQVGRGQLSLNSLEEMVEREKAVIGSAVQTTVAGLESGIGDEEEEDATEHIPSPWSNVDRKIGGGFPKKSYVLLGGATDAGKTSVATQIAGHSAKLGYNVLFLTTEDPLQKIQGRILSNLANIPYDMVKEKVVPRLLPENHRNSMEAVLKDIGPRIRIVDWALEADVDVTASLGGLLDRLESEGWLPDMIILDWIGGAMGEMTDERLALLRHIMMRVSNYMALLARTKNISTLATCQLDPKKGYGKAPTHVDVAENKKLAVPAQYFFALTATMVDESDESSAFEEDQIFNITKCKGAKGGKVKLRRALHYQRFDQR